VENFFSGIIEVLIDGVTISGPYALVAIGFSLVYGVSRVFNYAYGSLLTVGGYFAWFLFSAYSWINYFTALALLIPFMFFLGLIIELTITRPLRRKEIWDISTLIATLGLGIVLSNMMLLLFGPYSKGLPNLGFGVIKILDVGYNGDRIIMLLLALAMVAILKILLSKTRIGMCMRSVSQDAEGAKIVGVPLNFVFATTFGLSTIFAGVSGVLLGSIYFLTPLRGWSHFIKCFVIVAFGGIGSISGAFYSAFILGISESFVSRYIGPMWVMPFWFFILLAVLSFRPRGLLGLME
jgi:branched-chain amino acid transport system permease protein